MSKISRLLDPYMAAMLAVIILASVLPAQGVWADLTGGAADLGIVFLFFLYGTRLSPQAALAGMAQWRLQIAVLLSTFLLFPLLALALKPIAGLVLPSALVTGIIFLCVMPSTVQSSIAFTSIARGNVAAALCAASASNIIGVFVSPMLAGWLLEARGIALSYTVFRDILLQLLAPFIMGQVMRPWIGIWVQKYSKILGYTDRGTILLIIYVAFSMGMRDHIWQEVNAIDLMTLSVILAVLLAVILVITGLIARRLMEMSVEDEIVLQFCGSKKSLASGLPMASVLFAGPQLSLIVLPLMVFHQMQLLVCAVLARRYALRSDEDQ